VYGCTRLPVLQRACSGVSEGLLSYKRDFLYLSAGFRQFSDMSRSGFPNRDEFKEEKGK
jgi:hypothetical protein